MVFLTFSYVAINQTEFVDNDCLMHRMLTGSLLTDNSMMFNMYPD
jgi:hypothetical protein